VSSLLVVFIPGLLMLATFGLQRLESGLDCDTVSATDVAQFLDQAQADDVHTLARDGMPEAIGGMHRRLQERVCEPEIAKLYITDDEWSNLPTPHYVDRVANTEFQPSPQANRV
jgi:hypothetical protein